MRYLNIFHCLAHFVVGPYLSRRILGQAPATGSQRARAEANKQILSRLRDLDREV